jgi:hypothetical protein
VAALMYQQANNHWLRKLAHGREVKLDPYGGYRGCRIHYCTVDTAQKPWHRPGQGLPLQSTTGWESTGQDSQHKIRSSTDSRTDPKLAPCSHN